MAAEGSDRQSPGQEVSPWSRPGVLLSGAFLLVLVLLGIVVAVSGGGARHRKTVVRAQIQTPSPAAASSTPSSSTACTLASGAQAVPSAGPPPARWETVGAMEVPQSPGVYGPERTHGIWSTCFAHSPTGALLAAINFYAESTTGVSAEMVMKRYAVGAPSNMGNNEGLDGSGPVQLAGYRYVSYTPSQAEISIVLQGPQGKTLAVVTTMSWRGGDWKYVFPSGGMPSYEVIPDLTGYVPWGDF